MYHFHATIHARPETAVAGPVVAIDGRPVPTLGVPPDVLAATAFACSFEQAAAALATLPRMYCEPDGSFVWVSARDEHPWQVDGNLYDRNGRLLFVDLKGTCPPAEFDRLLACLGWPRQPIVLQLVRQAVFVDEAQFRRVSQSDASVGGSPAARP